MENKLNSLKLAKMQKKGNASAKNLIYILIGALIVITLVVQLAPEFFSGLGASGLGNATANPDVPSWLPTILIIIIGAGLVFLIWRIFDGGM